MSRQSMASKEIESCGRCSLSTVVEASGDGGVRDVFGEARIEVEEDEVRRTMAIHVAAGRVKQWFDAMGTRLTYGGGFSR